MPGKICNGSVNVPANYKTSRAYCEGKDAAARGLPDTENPHIGATEEWGSWQIGWSNVEAPDGDITEWDCCAQPSRSAVGP